MPLRSKLHPDTSTPLQQPEAPRSADGVDRLLLEELTHLLDQLPGDTPGQQLQVTLSDAVSAQFVYQVADTLTAAHLTLHNDSLHEATTLDADIAAQCPPDIRERISRAPSPAFADALNSETRIVLMRLPKAVDQVEEAAHTVAAHASAQVAVLAGGRVKHMTRRQNDALGVSFTQVSASLGRYKSRVLRASGPREPLPGARFPVRSELAGISVAAHGGVFAGATLDIGSRFLLDALPALLTSTPVEHLIDVGSGNGLLGVWVAYQYPDVAVTMTDVSALAVASSRETARLNGVADKVRVSWQDSLSAEPDASADVVVCNPPFHDGSALTTSAAQRIMADAGRVLRPGGRMWTVFNTSLAYAAVLRREVGPTRVVASNAKFTITESVRR
ncbi:class I SAM-dependent methyltransferase [Jonesia quinghaiensis]|uniref:class I SAM-dependent methyltransferase n=1 Tax=Jonesia quinghaiensis TaxID=262806 RepID=UPI0003F88462|nr:class I SAM-dependent methyltransferase [Jonesia quinghaiensis]